MTFGVALAWSTCPQPGSGPWPRIWTNFTILWRFSTPATAAPTWTTPTASSAPQSRSSRVSPSPAPRPRWAARAPPRSVGLGALG
uniref:Secreted protein n=1 Tax=Cyanoderma ruficeps TaxID=181631 RepID=A0A8C3QJP2_9PASS